MLRPCGRKLCVCIQEILPLYTRIPLTETEEKTTLEQIKNKKKWYKGCYGSYKVMLSNLEQPPLQS